MICQICRVKISVEHFGTNCSICSACMLWKSLLSVGKGKDGKSKGKGKDGKGKGKGQGGMQVRAQVRAQIPACLVQHVLHVTLGKKGGNECRRKGGQEWNHGLKLRMQVGCF